MIDKKDIPAEFDKIAHRYDIVNKLISFGMDAKWKNKLVALIPPHSQQVLDIAAGTGDIANKAAKTLPTAEITAVDASEKMLETAKQKALKSKLENRINFVKADMLSLPFDNHSFDCITMVYGLRNAPDAAGALYEIHRVLRPGGTALIMEFAMPPTQPFRLLFNIYFRWVMPIIAGLITGNIPAYRYLNKTLEDFYPPEKTAEIITNTGFKVVNTPLAGKTVWIFHARKTDG